MKEISNEIRRTVLDMVYRAQSSHIGSNFSCIDILTVLYEKSDLAKDKILISKGWIAASVYALLARKKVIPKKALKSYCQPNSEYIGLLEPGKGVECAGGSMGYGLPFAVGFALAKKIKGEEGLVHVLMSDGEQAIGTTWESLLIASHHRLNNLVVWIDFNKLQAMGASNDILKIDPLKDKYKAFGFEVREVDGHNHDSIEKALTWPKLYQTKPLVVICHTTKGKGWGRAENNNLYHYKNLSKEEYEEAKNELA